MKKAQVDGVIYVMVLIVIVGILLFIFQPTIETFRLEAIESLDDHPEQYNVFSSIFLYSLKPLIWFFYIFLSVIVLFATVNPPG